MSCGRAFPAPLHSQPKPSVYTEKETAMAVQQNKKSRSRKGMRRSHDRVAVPAVIYCTCGEPTLPHSVCPNCGEYTGRKVIAGNDNA